MPAGAGDNGHRRAPAQDQRRAWECVDRERTGCCGRPGVRERRQANFCRCRSGALKMTLSWASIQRPRRASGNKRSGETARGSIIDILDRRLVAEPRISEPGCQFPVMSIGHLAIEQQREPIRMRERGGVAGCENLAKGLGHAEQPKRIELIEVRTGGIWSPNGNSVSRGYWGGGSSRRPGRADGRRGGPNYC